MDVKFTSILKSFFPKGLIWDFQQKFNYLINGISIEFGRSYDAASTFYRNFNIIQNDTLASSHGRDYLIVSGLYTNREIQRIIVEYLNKDLSFKEIIQDFADFINVEIAWGLIAPLEFGVFQFGDEFGDNTTSEIANLFLTIGVDVEISCQDYNKIKWLVEYLKPPYLSVTFSDAPINSVVPFTFGYSQFGDDFGELVPC